MNKNVVLSNLLFANSALETMIAEKRDEALVQISSLLKDAISNMHEQEAISTPETEIDVIRMLVVALQPFARVVTPDLYQDSAPVAVEITIPREIAEKYAVVHDEMSQRGEKPNFARPNLETQENWPTQILNVEGINIGDIRFARKALETITASDKNTMN